MDSGLVWLVLLPSSLCDLYRYRIPNFIPAAGLILSLFRHLKLHGFVGIEAWLAGVIIPYILFFILYRLHALGASDGKLIAVVGGYVGVPDIFNVIIYSLMAGALMGIIKLYINGNLIRSIRNIYLCSKRFLETKNPRELYVLTDSKNAEIIPYGVAVAFGTFIYYALRIY